ncbi:MAG: tRNA (cytidine(34)-2'-O)-methyltransferase [Clostridia bacterium]|nr:tRNA (cytidine(34)-2'-O)-methyltransferase [Clostridia bacterium]
MINIVLLEPEIPNNTGNIVRTCAATGAVLHVIEPCGFSWEDKYLKRSGLDYWELSDVRRYKDIYDFLDKNTGYTQREQPAVAVKNAFSEAGKQVLFASTKAPRNHVGVNYEKECYVFFGRETRGLPESMLSENYDNTVRIPMREGTRSLNLANSAAIIIYEYLRQYDFAGMKEQGALTGRND